MLREIFTPMPRIWANLSILIVVIFTMNVTSPLRESFSAYPCHGIFGGKLETLPAR